MLKFFALFNVDLLELRSYSLFTAIESNDLSVLLRLLETQKKNINQYDEFGHTPLHSAFVKDQDDCLVALLKAGADPNLPFKTGFLKCVPLQFCTKNKTEWPIIRLFVSYGAHSQGVIFRDEQAKIKVEALEEEVRQRDQLLREIKEITDGLTDNRIRPVSLLSVMEKYKRIGDYWYEMFTIDRQERRRRDRNPIFQAHYWDRAVEYYQRLGALFLQLPQEDRMALTEYQTVFQRVIEEAAEQRSELIPVFSRYTTSSLPSNGALEISDTNINIGEGNLRHRNTYPDGERTFIELSNLRPQ